MAARGYAGCASRTPVISLMQRNCDSAGGVDKQQCNGPGARGPGRDTCILTCSESLACGLLPGDSACVPFCKRSFNCV